MWLVVNPFRACVSSLETIAEQAGAIETTSHLRLTGLVANPHLGPLTGAAEVRAGLEEVGRSADLLGLPVVFLAAEACLLDQAASLATPVLVIQRLLRHPWEAE